MQRIATPRVGGIVMPTVHTLVVILALCTVVQLAAPTALPRGGGLAAPDLGFEPLAPAASLHDPRQPLAAQPLP